MKNIKFEDRIKQIKNKLSNLERVGIDTQEYRYRLGNIEVENNISYIQENYNSASVSQINDKTNKNEYLLFLEFELSKYDFIISFYNYCNKINSNLIEMLKKSKDEINIDELNSYISKIEDYLINLYNDKDNNISNKLLIKIFEVVYNLIDTEIIVANRSTLYDFIKDKNIDTRYINSILCSEINNINNDDTYESKQLKKYLNDIIVKTNNTGLNNNYFNLEIIKLLLMYKSKYDVYDELSFEFNGNFAHYIGHYLNNDDISNISSEIDKYAFSLTKSKEEKKESKIALIKRSIASTLAASIVLTGAYGLEKGVRKLSTLNSYIKTTEITSSFSKNKVIQEEVMMQGSNHPSERYIQVVTPWTNDKNNYISRSIQKYDVTYLDLPDLSNLDNIDLNSLDIIPNVYEEKINKDEIGYIQKHNKNIRELVDIDYEYNGKKLSKKIYVSFMLLIISVLMFIKTLLNEHCYDSFDNRKTLKEIIEFYIKNKNNFENNYYEYQKLVDKLLASLSANQELLNLFNKIYNENINLISNDYELEEKIDNMIESLKQDYNNMNMILERIKK